ncbi:Hypothetical protein, putative [Bodo saltans]|uniref:EDRF1 N-terminal domain-containing protein n=1 Tax=Bodo saltans TaxID=75058 RepID=A0A0S4IJC2_BODSA|nr:Hypothetical protein, putative [Bodo saltans]|eukprot:CUE79139.1 Hypothetical protein, putative [Bodo saltans]
MHERVESSQENTVKVPPIDPVTGQVMTKRAIRRRIVKNWERKQKELLSDSHQVRSSSNSDPPHTEETGTRNPAAEELDDTTTTPPSVRAPSTTSFISAVATTHHPLRNAAAVPVVSGRFLDSNGAPLFRLGSCLPNIDQRPPFEFLFRMPNSSSLETTTVTPSVFQKPELGTEEDERDDTAASRQRRSNCAVVDDAFLAALALRDRSSGGECDEDDRHSGGVEGAAGSRNHGPSPRGRNNGGAPQAPSSKLPIPNLFAAYTNDDDEGGGGGISSPTSPAGFLAFRPVIRRVERQAPLPLAPFSPGTDLNPPPENYLSMDSVWGLHRHAPGFYRDAEAATHSLMSAATRIFSDEGRAVNVISTGEAMTRLFESSFRADQPFTVHVHRVGPAIVLHAPEHGMPQETIEQVRKKALLSKALYRMSNGGPRQLTARLTSSDSGSPTTQPGEYDRALALRGAPETADMPRAGSLAFTAAVQHNAGLHNFGNVLHWGIQNLEVLIGLDTPVLLDRDHENAEVAFAMHDALSGMEISNPSQVQYDALRCWFESTLANVAHVGFCVHNRGIVQSFELKKVTDLLTFAEAQVATAAMGFTTNALRWLTEHCTEDGTDYAVIRNPETNTLELYALHHTSPGSATHQQHHVEGVWASEEEEMNDDVDVSVENSHNPVGGRSSGRRGSAVPHHSTMPGGHGGGHHPPSLDVTLAVLCYRMGIHLLEKGKPAEALKLLLRSFQIHHLHCHDETSAAPMLDICARLPAVVKQYLLSELPLVAMATTTTTTTTDEPASFEVPSKFQEVMFACMRIEDRVRQMLEYYTVPGRNNSSNNAAAAATASASAATAAPGQHRVALSAPSLANMLLWCAAALGLIVDGCIGWWCNVHACLTTLKRSVVHRQRDSAVQLHTVIFKELVQVALEGVVVLEGICLALRPGATDATASFPEVGTSVAVDACQSSFPQTSRKSDNTQSCSATPNCCTALARTTTAHSQDEFHLHQILPTRELVQLTTAICEVLGDMCLCALADGSPTTLTTLVEVSQLMLTTTARTSPSLAVFTKLREGGGGGGGGETAIFQETMQWYSKVQKVHSGRHQSVQRKIATAYFHYAVQFHKTDRWTKAVENLKRALDALIAPVSQAAAGGPTLAPIDEAKGVVCVTTEQVRLELCVVWLKMCRRRRDQLPPAIPPPAQPNTCLDVSCALLHRTCPQLATELFRPLVEDEHKQMQYCLSELRECESFYQGVRRKVAPSTTDDSPDGSKQSHSSSGGGSSVTTSTKGLDGELNNISMSLIGVEVLFATRLCQGAAHYLRFNDHSQKQPQQQKDTAAQLRVAEGLLVSASDRLLRGTFDASSSLVAGAADLSGWVAYGWVTLLSYHALSLLSNVPRSVNDALSKEALQTATQVIRLSSQLRGSPSRSTGEAASLRMPFPSAAAHRVVETLVPTISVGSLAQEGFVTILCAIISADHDIVKLQKAPLFAGPLRNFHRDLVEVAEASSERTIEASACVVPHTPARTLIRLCCIALEALQAMQSTPPPSSAVLSRCFNILTELLRGVCVALSQCRDESDEVVRTQLGKWKAVLGNLFLARSEMATTTGDNNASKSPSVLLDGLDAIRWNQLFGFVTQCLS